MKALILNSGLGSRMGDMTKSVPKCMSIICESTTILSAQIRMLLNQGINEIVITTGAHREVLTEYSQRLFPEARFTFVHNSDYAATNYIYSIYLARNYLQDDIVLMHGDLIFDEIVLKKVLTEKKSCVVINKQIPLPEKDFKAVIQNNRVSKIGIEFFENAVASQPLYKLNQKDWDLWLKAIEKFCKEGIKKVYAENALNTITDKLELIPVDAGSFICQEVDTVEDLNNIKSILYGRKQGEN